MSTAAMWESAGAGPTSTPRPRSAPLPRWLRALGMAHLSSIEDPKG